jgi:hypothetical protein
LLLYEEEKPLLMMNKATKKPAIFLKIIGMNEICPDGFIRYTQRKLPFTISSLIKQENAKLCVKLNVYISGLTKKQFNSGQGKFKTCNICVNLDRVKAEGKNKTVEKSTCIVPQISNAFLGICRAVIFKDKLEYDLNLSKCDSGFEEIVL